MNTRTFIATALITLACPLVASAQTASPVPSSGGGGGTIGVGAFGQFGVDNVFGLTIPIDVTRSLRIQPDLMFRYQRVSATQTNTTFNTTGTSTQSETAFGLGVGIHSFFAGNSSARALIGGDIQFLRADSTSTVTLENGGTVNETTSEGDGASLIFLSPVIGGEIGIAGGVRVGLRAGPQFLIGFPDVDENDNIDSSSVFRFGGVGRLEASYFF